MRLSKQNSQSSSTTFIYKNLIIPSFLDSCFISSTVSEDKRVNEKYKIVQSTSKFQNLLRIGMLVWGEADSETSSLKSLGRKLFKTCCMNWGEVNPVHAYYNGSRTSKDNEDPSWNTSFKTRRTQKTTSALEALWKTLFNISYHRSSIQQQCRGEVVLDLLHYEWFVKYSTNMRRTDADFSHAPPNEYSPSPDDKKQWSLYGCWFGGKLISRNFAKKESMKKAFQDMLHGIGGSLINIIATTMVPEQVKTMKIQAGIQVSRPGELTRQLQLWKRFGRFYLIVFVLVSNIFPEVKGWLDEDLDNYHLKELRCSTQCHTQMSMWIISRGVVLLILLMLGISFKFDISGLLPHVITTIAYRIRDKDTLQSKQNLQRASMTFIHKDLDYTSVLDFAFNSFTVSRSKLEYKFQDKEYSEDIFSSGSALEDFICVVFVPDRNIESSLNEVVVFLAAAAEVEQKRGHVLSFLTKEWSKEVNKLLEGF
ncbi:hypothetical protein Tco_0680397 [Tanacetum coccineum]|uniref:Uncharacterized protein n=1 Tax=Tanacetum coccineum TaxID=301880 RepID=A0ABQ4XKF6_9ASTR